MSSLIFTSSTRPIFEKSFFNLLSFLWNNLRIYGGPKGSWQIRGSLQNEKTRNTSVKQAMAKNSNVDKNAAKTIKNKLKNNDEMKPDSKIKPSRKDSREKWNTTAKWSLVATWSLTVKWNPAKYFSPAYNKNKFHKTV